jgi:phosphonate transport system substrate-binding protein
MKKNTWLVMLVLFSILALALTGCGTSEPGEKEDNPLVWSFVPSGEMERVAAGGQAVADLIEAETGLFIETNVATEYAGVIEAMCSDPVEAHMGSLATFAYVMAAQRGCAEAALVSVRYGSATYNGQIIVRADSGITELSQLADKTFCRPDPLSTSGWIIPQLDLRAAGVDPDTGLAEVVDAGSHDAVVAAVYNGDCDAGATYVDARGTIEDDNPDVNEVVAVIHVSTDIPNDGLQFAPSVDEETRTKIVDALLKIAETEEGQEALDTAYQWTALEKHGDEFYDPFRQLLDAAGMDITALQE